MAQEPQEAEHRQHAARGHRDGHGRLGAAGRRDARAPASVLRPGKGAASCRRKMRRPRPAGRQREEAALRDVLAFLRSRTGRDFTTYKRATVVRRIARRMQVNGVSRPAGLPGLPAHPPRAKPDALLQDLLISVTNFFRDADCFDALDAQLRRAVQGHGAPATRSGSGCRHARPARRRTRWRSCWPRQARQFEAPPVIQIFATDLDERAIKVARDGTYPIHDRGRRVGGAPAALLHQRAARLPGAPRTARDGAVRAARRAEGFAVLAARPGLLPQPADLPEPRRAKACPRHLPLRAGAAAGGCSWARRKRPKTRRSLFTVLDKKHRIFASAAVAPRRRCRCRSAGGTLALALDSAAADAVRTGGRHTRSIPRRRWPA